MHITQSQLTTDRETVEIFVISLQKALAWKNFMAVRGCFVLGTAHIKAIGLSKKEKERLRNSIFTSSRFVTLALCSCATLELDQHYREQI